MEANFLILNIEGSYLYKDNWFKMDFNQFHIYIDGTIESSGSDIIGKFEIKGKLEQDRSINFIKQYIEQHSVEYKGKLIENQIKGNDNIIIF